MANGNPLVERLIEQARSTPDSVFLRRADTQVRYGEFLHQVSSRAAHFRACGAEAGNKVAIYCDDEVEFQVSLFAIWVIGAVCIPINVTQRPEVIATIEQIVTPDVGFGDADVVADVAREFPLHKLRGESATAGTSDVADVDPSEPAIIMFTSGTSGTPKAVPMTAAAIAANAQLTSRALGIGADDRILINSPPYYTSPIIHILTFLTVGGSVAIHQGMLLGEDLLRKVEELECTGFGGVPVHLIRLAGVAQDDAARANLKFLMNSGEHLPVPILETLSEKFPATRLFCVYGLTEVAGRLCILPPELLPAKIGSVGRPIGEMTVEVLDENLNPLPVGEMGQVFVRGPLLMSGYINNPQANRALTEGGFATGDFGRLDEDGCLYLGGRNDDIVKVGGEKVSISMIEDAAFRIDAFHEHAVVAIMDKHMGNVPCLFYSLQPEASIKRKEIVKSLRSSLPPNHIPVHIVEVPEIPRSTSGKISRKDLVNQYQDNL